MSLGSQRVWASCEVPLAVRALLVHITHYDPKWVPEKDQEERFSLKLGLDIVEQMSEVGFNTLVVDIGDGVRYESHPELQRPYSAPMADLRALSQGARDHGISFVPKLNFAKSGRNLHDMWMKPHWDLRNFVSRRKEYFEVATDLIDELVEICQPSDYFHIGMDEDHHRSLDQFVGDIKQLRKIISEHGLRTVMWNDTCYENRNVIAQVHADKCRAAEPRLPKDIVQVLWDYDIVHRGIVERLAKAGFEVWVAPGRTETMIREWKEVLCSEGGNRGKGLLMSNWLKCGEGNRETIVALLDELGPFYGP